MMTPLASLLSQVPATPWAAVGAATVTLIMAAPRIIKAWSVLVTAKSESYSRKKITDAQVAQIGGGSPAPLASDRAMRASLIARGRNGNVGG